MHHYVTGQRPQIMAWMISIRYSRRKEGQIERSMFSCQSSRDMGGCNRFRSLTSAKPCGWPLDPGRVRSSQLPPQT